MTLLIASILGFCVFVSFIGFGAWVVTKMEDEELEKQKVIRYHEREIDTLTAYIAHQVPTEGMYSGGFSNKFSAITFHENEINKLKS